MAVSVGLYSTPSPWIQPVTWSLAETGPSASGEYIEIMTAILVYVIHPIRRGQKAPTHILLFLIAWGRGGDSSPSLATLAVRPVIDGRQRTEYELIRLALRMALRLTRPYRVVGSTRRRPMAAEQPQRRHRAPRRATCRHRGSGLETRLCTKRE